MGNNKRQKQPRLQSADREMLKKGGFKFSLKYKKNKGKNNITNSVNSEMFTTKDNRTNKKGGVCRQNRLISLNSKKKKGIE